MKRRSSIVIILLSISVIIGILLAYSAVYVATNKIYKVASMSMQPALNIDDVILVQTGFTVDDIHAAYGTGDIIAFYKPGDPDEVIVHRAVEKNGDSIRTKGDANTPIDNWSIFDQHLIGKVVEINPLQAILFTIILSSWLFWIIVIIALIVASIIMITKGRKQEKIPASPSNLAQKEERKLEGSFFCRYCGFENKSDATFCEKCGKKID